MRFRESVTLHSVFLFLCGFAGMGVGFWWYARVSARAPNVDLRLMRSELAAARKPPTASVKPAEFYEVKIPIYEGKAGPCIAEITAEKMTYPSDEEGKVYMTKPYVRRFTEDGQLVMELWGDEGEVEIVKRPDGKTDYSDVSVKGNTKMRRYAIKKKEEEPSDRAAPR